MSIVKLYFIYLYLCPVIYSYTSNQTLSCLINPGAIAVGSQFFGEGTRPILITNINCSGTEQSLLNCMHNNGSTCTTERDDAGVVCQGL